MRWMHLKSWGFKMKVLVYGYGLMGKKIAHKVRSQNDMELMGIVSYELMKKFLIWSKESVPVNSGFPKPILLSFQIYQRNSF
mgnify:CR=1 FL=1